MAIKTYKPILIDSIIAETDFEKQRLIGFDGNYCKKGAKALGVSDVEIEKGQYAPVAISGILLVVTGGKINKGDIITSDDIGRAISASSGTINEVDDGDDSTRLYSFSSGDEINGYALDSASAEGEVIRIVRGV